MYKMVDISVETQNKAEVSVINIHENNNSNKTLLKLIYIPDTAKRWGDKNIYDLIDKEIKGKYKVTSMSVLTKQKIKKYKIDRSILIKDSKHSIYVYEDIKITIVMDLFNKYSTEKTELEKIIPEVTDFVKK